MSDLPEDWRVVRLGEVASESTQRNGGGFTHSDLYGVLKSDGLVPMRERVKGKTVERCKVVRPNAFAYNPMRLNIGSIARSVADRAVIVSPDYVVFECDPTRLDPSFLDYMRRTHEWEQFVRPAGTGSVRTRIYFSALAEFTFSLPSLPEQKKIAAVLSSVDRAVEATRLVVERMSRLTQSVTASLVLGRAAGAALRDTDIGLVPASWSVARLEDVASVERGKFSHRPRNEPRFFGGDIPFVQTGDIAASGGRLTSYTQTLNEEGLAVSKVFAAGTILITIAANIGETAIAAFPVAAPDSVVGITPRSGLHVRYLEYYLRTRKADLNRAATESAQKNINLQTLRPLSVPMPPIVDQERIVGVLDSMEKLLALERGQLVALENTRRGLMQDLLTGRRRVELVPEHAPTEGEAVA